jgi:drug/metabolite transporter (DMT)-like permease
MRHSASTCEAGGTMADGNAYTSARAMRPQPIEPAFEPLSAPPQSNRRPWQYILALASCLLAVALWGTVYPVYGRAMRTVDPLTIGVIRNIIIAFASAAGLLVLEGPRAFKTTRREFWLAAGAGIIGVVGFGILTFVGEHLAGTGSNAAKLTAVYAMALMVLWQLASLVQSTSLPGLLELALVLGAYAGLALMIAGGGASGLFSLQGILAGGLVLAGTACWMWYTLLFRKFGTWSVLKFSAITFLLGTGAFTLLEVLAIGASVLPVPHVSALLSGSPAYLYLGLLTGVVPLILWNRSSRVITPVNALMFMSVGTAVTVLIANHMSGYRENGTTMVVGGIAMILAIGLYSAMQYRASLPKHSTAPRASRKPRGVSHATPATASPPPAGHSSVFPYRRSL